MSTTIARRRHGAIPLQLPDRARLLDGSVERCGHCMLLWPSDDMRDEAREDGLARVCPRGSSPSTDLNYTADVRARVVANAERFIPRPNISLAPLEPEIPPTVVSIVDSNGHAVHNGCPLRVARGAVGVLIMHGRSFPAVPLPLFAFPSGVTTASAATSDAAGLAVTLEFTVSPVAPAGTYDIAFSNGILHNVLMVR